MQINYYINGAEEIINSIHHAYKDLSSYSTTYIPYMYHFNNSFSVLAYRF